MTPDPRDARIAELEAQLGARGFVTPDPRDARIAELERLLAAALARIAELEELVRKSSNNSSKPPSSDAPGKKL